MQCDVNSLARASSCLRCLTDGQLSQIKTYLLCRWAAAATGISAPGSIDISIGSDEASRTVTWINGSSPGSTNELWKSTDGVTFVLLTTVAGSATSANDVSAMADGDIFYYKVRACSGGNCSAFSSTVSISNNYTSPNVAVISFPTLVRAVGFFRAIGLPLLTSVSLPALKTVRFDEINLSLNVNLTSVNLNSLISVGSSLFFGGSNLTGAVSFPALVTIGSGGNGDFQIQSNALMTSLSAPLLVSIEGNFIFSGCASLTSVTLTSLNSVGLGAGGRLDFSGDTSLPSISFPALAAVGDYIDGNGCTLLTSVQLPNWGSQTPINVYNVRFDGCPALVTWNAPIWFISDGFTIEFSAAALNVASINQILARGVNAGDTTSIFQLAGGTNAAPAGQGVVDKATLIGNGCTVNTN